MAKPYARRAPHARCHRRVPATAPATSPAPTPGAGHPVHTISGPLSPSRAGRRPRQPPPRLATLSLPAMPDTCTPAAPTQMNSSAEISRLPLASHDEPGQPGPDRRPPRGGRRWPPRVRLQRGERQPLRPLSDACKQAACALSWPRPQSRRRSGGGNAGTGTGRPPLASARHTAVRSRAERVHAPRPACSVMSGSPGQPAMIRQGSEPGPVSAAKLARPACEP